MENKKIIKFLTFFILIQPFFDVFIYFTNKVIEIDIPFISFLRPLIAIGIYVYLLFNNKVSSKEKKISFIYLVIYAISWISIVVCLLKKYC